MRTCPQCAQGRPGTMSCCPRNHRDKCPAIVHRTQSSAAMSRPLCTLLAHPGLSQGAHLFGNFFFGHICAHFIKGKVFIKPQIIRLKEIGRRRRRLQVSRSVMSVVQPLAVQNRSSRGPAWRVSRSRRRLQLSGSAITQSVKYNHWR